MLLTDAQIHLWEAESPDRPWRKLERPPHRSGGFYAEEMLEEMDRAGVDRAVIVPPTWAGEDNGWALQMAARYPQRFAVIGRLDATAKDARDQVRGWLTQKGMLGVRMSFHVRPFSDGLEGGTLDW